MEGNILIEILLAIIAISGLIVSTNSQNCIDSYSRPGKCITMANCPQLVDQFYDETRVNSHNLGFQAYASGSLCGFNGNHFLVCCSTHGTPTVKPHAPSQRPGRYQPFPSYPALPSPTTSSLSSTYELYFVSLNVPPTGNVVLPSAYPLLPTTATTVVFQPTFPNRPSPILTTPPTPYNPPVPGPTNSNIYQPIPSVPSLPNNFPTSAPFVKQPVSSGSSNCGISRGTTNRVVGGVEAKRGTYPWMAALGYNENNALKFLCAGSLISPRYVVTSAHCITPTLMLVRLGAHNLAHPKESGAMDFTVKRTVAHENFDLKAIVNDIALIELSSVAPRTDFIAPICLPESSIFLSDDFVGMHPFVVGWGSTKYQGATSDVLRDAQVPIESRQACEQSYKSVFQYVQFSEKLICAGTSNVDACQGDSGGPLMLPQLDVNVYRYYLLGIVSYGYECARPGFPGVYTRVAAYIPWIKSHMI